MIALSNTGLNKVLFAGGGTGGHVYMAVAVAEALKTRYPSIRILFAGTKDGLEQRILPSLGFDLKTIRIGGMKNVGLKKLFTTLFQLPGSLIASFSIARRFKPSIVIGVGGYSSGPIVLASRIMRIPALLLEPNVLPGFTNRILSRWCQGAGVAYEETASSLGSKARITGIPVRAEFFQIPEAGPTQERLRVLVFGGSRGSHPINLLMTEAMALLPESRFKIVHQTGPNDFEMVTEKYRTLGVSVETTPYIDNMPELFKESDLLISRAGASTIAEIAAAGRPAVLIPFPHAADDHQSKNAAALASRGAAVALDQATLTGEKLCAQLIQLEQDRPLLAKMARSVRQLAKPEATNQIIEYMEEILD